MSAVPIEATTGSNPAWRNAITSVFPSTTAARSCFAIARWARCSPYSTEPLWKSSPSGELTYFPRSGSSSASLRAWNPSTRPRESQSGNIKRRREVVASAHRRQPGGAQLLVRESPLPCLLARARARREPEPELARHLLAEPALGEIRPDVCARPPPPTGAARSTTPSARGARRGARAACGSPRPAVRSPRTRAGRGSARQAPRRRRRSRGPPSPGTNVITSPAFAQPKQ